MHDTVFDVCIVTAGTPFSAPRVMKEITALTEAGLSVAAVMRRSPNDSSQSEASIAHHITFVPERTDGYRDFVRKVRFRLGRKLFDLGFSDLDVWALFKYAPEMISATLAIPARLYIAHGVVGLVAAGRAAIERGVPYAFDAEDFHIGELNDTPSTEVTRRVFYSIEREYISGAAYVTSASPLIADAYEETYRISPPTVILNTFPLAHAPVGPTPQGEVTPGPSVYWFSQTVGAGRGLETAVAAIALCRTAPHLFLRGAVAKGFDRTLMSLASGAGVADRLHFLPVADSSCMERLNADFDLGYVGELGEPLNRRIALTNKLFSYILGGIPVVASDIPAHRALAPELGLAMRLFAIDNAAELAAAFDSYLLSPGLLATARRQAWQLGQTRFNAETEMVKLIACVRQALHVHTPSHGRNARSSAVTPGE